MNTVNSSEREMGEIKPFPSDLEKDLVLILMHVDDSGLMDFDSEMVNQVLDLLLETAYMEHKAKRLPRKEYVW